MFNGDKGRLELEVVETSHRTARQKGGKAQGMSHGVAALPNEGKTSIKLQKLWETAVDVPFEIVTGDHGE